MLVLVQWVKTLVIILRNQLYPRVLDFRPLEPRRWHFTHFRAFLWHKVLDIRLVPDIIIFMDFINLIAFDCRSLVLRVKHYQVLLWRFLVVLPGVVDHFGRLFSLLWGLVVVLWLVVEVYTGGLAHGLVFSLLAVAFYEDGLALRWDLALVEAGLVSTTKNVLVGDVLVDLTRGFLGGFDELILFDVGVLDPNLPTGTFLLLKRTHRLYHRRLTPINVRSLFRQSLMRTALHSRILRSFYRWLFYRYAIVIVVLFLIVVSLVLVVIHYTVALVWIRVEKFGLGRLRVVWALAYDWMLYVALAFGLFWGFLALGLLCWRMEITTAAAESDWRCLLCSWGVSFYGLLSWGRLLRFWLGLTWFIRNWNLLWWLFIRMLLWQFLHRITVHILLTFQTHDILLLLLRWFCVLHQHWGFLLLDFILLALGKSWWHLRLWVLLGSLEISDGTLKLFRLLGYLWFLSVGVIHLIFDILLVNLSRFYHLSALLHAIFHIVRILKFLVLYWLLSSVMMAVLHVILVLDVLPDGLWHTWRFNAGLMEFSVHGYLWGLLWMFHVRWLLEWGLLGLSVFNHLNLLDKILKTNLLLIQLLIQFHYQPIHLTTLIPLIN